MEDFTFHLKGNHDAIVLMVNSLLLISRITVFAWAVFHATSWKDSCSSIYSTAMMRIILSCSHCENQKSFHVAFAYVLILTLKCIFSCSHTDGMKCENSFAISYISIRHVTWVWIDNHLLKEKTFITENEYWIWRWIHLLFFFIHQRNFWNLDKLKNSFVFLLKNENEPWKAYWSRMITLRGNFLDKNDAVIVVVTHSWEMWEVNGNEIFACPCVLLQIWRSVFKLGWMKGAKNHICYNSF